MGEVFRARDTTLNRDVAIKVLPAAMAGDPERLARFKREAQVLASLSHSNIALVYGFEESVPSTSSGTATASSVPARAEPGRSVEAPVRFLIMELVEDEDLSERLKRGAIPVEESIAIAKQIAEGLEEAHEHGIIHRDLKPANVKVTPDGYPPGRRRRDRRPWSPSTGAPACEDPHDALSPDAFARFER